MDSVLIMVPHTGWLRYETVGFLLSSTIDRGFSKISIDLNYGIPVDFNRNLCVKKFLQSDHDWLFFLDSDMVPPPNIFDLTRHHKPIISAVSWGWKNGSPMIMAFNETEVSGVYEPTCVSGLQKVDAIGTGCLFIHKSVFDSIEPPYFLFERDHEGLMKLGEDFYFCRKAIDAGYSIYVHGGYKCSHIREVDFKRVNDILLEMEATLHFSTL